MINRLCKHFAHKINAGWSDTQGYIEFAMGFCDMNADTSYIQMRCGADSKADLNEIIACINDHFYRFAKTSNACLTWRCLTCVVKNETSESETG